MLSNRRGYLISHAMYSTVTETLRIEETVVAVFEGKIQKKKTYQLE